jgi:hypothetical protein
MIMKQEIILEISKYMESLAVNCVENIKNNSEYIVIEQMICTICIIQLKSRL